MIIVLGKNGQLSKSFQEELKNNKIKFNCYGSSEINFLKTNTFKKLNKINYDILINTSAFTAVDNSEKKKREALKVNSTALRTLANICNKKKALLIHFSTDYIFNKKKGPSIEENYKTNPVNYYGYTKLIGEKNIINYSKRYIIFRVSWLCSKFSGNFLTKISDKILNNQDLKVVDDQIGCPTFCNDVVKVILKLILNKKIFINENMIFNLTNSGKCSWYTYSKFILDQIKKHKKYRFLNNKIQRIKTRNLNLPAKRPYFSLLNKEKFEKKFQIKMPHWKFSCKKNLLMYLDQ